MKKKKTSKKKINVRNTIAKKGSRPLKFKTVAEMQAVIDEYFNWCDMRIIKGWNQKEEKEFAYISPAPYTMHGLARRIGLSRQGLIEYSRKSKFSDTIKEAREKIAEDVETRLMEGRTSIGAIFNLKNNFGWKDKNETEHSGHVDLWSEEPPK